MIKKMINAFPFYNKIEMQNRFKDNSANNCEFALISPKNAFLPFQIAVKGVTEINKIYVCISKFNRTDISENINLIKVINTEDYTYFQYDGQVINFMNNSIKLDGVHKWLEIEFTNGDTAYSEVFKGCGFEVGKPCKYLKIEYSSSGDLPPILYHDGFKQVIYLDTFIHNDDPEIEEEVRQNSKGQMIRLRQQMFTNHKIVDLTPNFLKLAISSLQMHDKVNIITAYDKEEITAENISTTSTPTSDGAYSTIEISIKQILLSLNACNSQIV